jgi:hypothetical protein
VARGHENNEQLTLGVLSGIMYMDFLWDLMVILLVFFF